MFDVGSHQTLQIITELRLAGPVPHLTNSRGIAAGWEATGEDLGVTVDEHDGSVIACRSYRLERSTAVRQGTLR